MESETNNRRTASRAKWQWQSNSNPWSKTEKPQWTYYSLEDNYLIEKAYHNQRKEVDLGDYVVSIQHMIQNKKGNITLQRLVRRIEYEEIEEVEMRSERYYESELPKTINKIFGSLEHFISFFSRRNQDILDLTNQFQKLEESNNIDEFNKIILPQLICCLKKELSIPIKDQLQDQSTSESRRKILLKTKVRHKGLISLFKTEFASYDEFYRMIFKSYTMNTDLYPNLNKYLRNENWIAIDNLLPYAICLCKAFFRLKLCSGFQKGEEPEEKETSITVYRGTALDEFTLSSYQVEKASKPFSWNSVTSASANREIAEKFMYDSVDMKNKKYPVLFIIKIPLVNELRESEYLKWIDIRQYSALPNEDEVILAPGSAFELEEISTDEEERTTIKLKLKHDVESLAHGGLIMQGALQNEMMSDKQFRIVCLRGEELFETFRSLSGNSLIEEIELSLCTLDQKSLEELLETLPTMKNVKALRLLSCQYENEKGIPSMKLKEAKSCNIVEVEISEVQDFYKIFSNLKDGSEYWASLRTLNIDFKDLKADKFEFQGLEQLSQLTSLTFGFQDCKEVKNKGLNNLACQGLKSLTQLTSLNLNFSNCGKVTGEGMANLAGLGLKPLTKLTSLNLNLSSCSKIINQGVKDLAFHGLKHLTQLASLTVNLSHCKQITDEGVKSLAFQGLQNLTQLTSLDLNFSYCDKIKNEGIENLISPAFKDLTQLNAFALNFSHCRQITDGGVTDLASKGLKNLTQLVSLNLDFSSCDKITENGVANLASEGLKHITRLISLDLNFSNCERIKNTGVISLATKGLQSLTQLNSFTLNMSHCRLITDEGIINLASQGLKCLTQLVSLTLDFSFCSRISDQELANLASQGFGGPAGLASLILDRKVIKSSCNYQIQEQNSPKYLFLKFSRRKAQNQFISSLGNCQASTDPCMSLKKSLDLTLNLLHPLTNPLTKNPKEIPSVNTTLETFSKACHKTDLAHYRKKKDNKKMDLAIQELENLTKLTSLTLNFICSPTTENKFNNFASYDLRCLSKLTSLTLNFFGSDMTDKKLESLASQGLRNLTNLTSFALTFFGSQIEDKGVIDMTSHGLVYLTQLTSLTLSFSGRSRITDIGLESLASQGLKNLTKLTSLDLNFSSCYGISDKGIKSLTSQGLQYLTQLTSLSLEFKLCDKITDQGMDYLASQGLKYLKRLNSLNLDFERCTKITDKGINSLISEGIRDLTHLTLLNLDFFECEIPLSAISNIIRVLHYFGFILEKMTPHPSES